MRALGLLRPPPQDLRTSIGLLLLRLFAGAAMMIHGWGKIRNPFGWAPEALPIPAFFQGLAALAEFGGGLAWILGLLTPVASFGMACTMAVAAGVHLVKFQHPLFATSSSGSAEPAATLLVVSLLLLLTGPGRFSADRVVFREKT